MKQDNEEDRQVIQVDSWDRHFPRQLHKLTTRKTEGAVTISDFLTKHGLESMAVDKGKLVLETKEPALTTVNSGTLNTGDATSDTIIGNMRTRINDLETRLRDAGILT